MALLPFTLYKAETDFLAVTLVLFIHVFDKGFQVGKWFISHGNALFS